MYWTDGLGVVFRSYCAHSATKAYPGEIQTQKLLSIFTAPPPPLAICNNWAAAALSAEILGMNPTWAELGVCARAQVAVRYEVNGRGRYRLLSHNMVVLDAQPAADSLPLECF